MGGNFQFGFDKKIKLASWASVSKKWRIFEGFFATIRSYKDGKVLFNGITKIWKTRIIGDITTINAGGDNLYTADQKFRMVEVLIDNIFIKFGGCLFRQVIEILMGTNRASC